MMQMYYDFLKQQKKKEKILKCAKKHLITCYNKERMGTLLHVT